MISVFECLALLVVVVVAAVIISGTTDARYDLDSLGASAADALLWLTQLTVLWFGRQAFRAATPRRDRRRAAQTAEADPATAQRILREVGGGRLSWMTTWFQPVVPGSRPTVVCGLQSHAGVSIALGDPVASDPAARQAMAAAFVDFAQVRGLLPCVFSAGAETADWARGRNWRAVEVAVEAVIDLPDLQFKGKAWQDVRSALNRAAKEGVTLELGTLPDMPVNRLAQVRSISEQWVGDKGLPEMGFTLGGVDEALDPAVRVALAVDGEGTVHG